MTLIMTNIIRQPQIQTSTYDVKVEYIDLASMLVNPEIFIYAIMNPRCPSYQQQGISPTPNHMPDNLPRPCVIINYKYETCITFKALIRVLP